MFNKQIIKWTSLSLIVVLLPLFTVCAQDKGIDRESLELTISLDKKEYLPLQQIVITAELKNISGKTLKLPSSEVINYWARLNAKVAIYIAKEGEEFDLTRPYCPQPLYACGADHNVEVKNGEVVIGRFKLLTYPKENLEFDIFNEPGSYKIMCIYRPHFNSNIINIKINKPEGDDKKAYEHLKKILSDKKSLIDFLTSPTLEEERTLKVDIPQKIKEFEEFLKLYPKSNYASYVEWTLGRYYKGEKSLPFLKKAIEQPEQFRFVDTDDALYRLTNHYISLVRTSWEEKRWDEAEKHLNEAEKWLTRLEEEWTKMHSTLIGKLSYLKFVIKNYKIVLQKDNEKDKNKE